MSKPDDKKQLGSIQCTIWSTELDKGVSYTYTLMRSYKDKDGEWQNTKSLRPQDAHAVQVLNTWAFERIAELRHGKKD